jgi:hypothetical protein
MLGAMHARLLIEATPKDLASIAAILPDGEEGTEHPHQRSSRLTGELIRGPEGATVHYKGMVMSRGDIPPVRQFVSETGAGVSAILITEWLLGRFRGRTDRISLNRREIDLDEAGQVRRIVEITRGPREGDG